MIKLEILTLSHYDLGNDLYDWWSNTSHCAWINVVNGSYYLSDNLYSAKYIVAYTLDGLVEYINELKDAYESEE